MPSETFVDVNDRVHTVLVAANVKAAIEDHATQLDAFAQDVLDTAQAVLDAQTAQTAAEAAQAAAEVAGVITFSLTIGEADFAAGAGAKTIDVLTPSATLITKIEDVWIDIREVFAGGSLTACTVSVGQDEVPTADAYVLAQNCFTGATLGTYGFKTAERGAERVPATAQPLLAATKKVQAVFTPTTDDMINATTGTVTVWVQYRLLPALV